MRKAWGNSWLSIRDANDLPGDPLHYRVPSIVHGLIINKLRVFSRALTRPPVAGSHPSPAPARRSFLRAPSTPHGTSCNSPEEEDTNKHLCYWSQLKCTGERETPGLHFIHPVGKKVKFLLLSHLCLCIRKESVFPALFQRCILLPTPCIMH